MTTVSVSIFSSASSSLLCDPVAVTACEDESDACWWNGGTTYCYCVNTNYECIVNIGCTPDTDAWKRAYQWCNNVGCECDGHHWKDILLYLSPIILIVGVVLIALVITGIRAFCTQRNHESVPQRNHETVTQHDYSLLPNVETPTPAGQFTDPPPYDSVITININGENNCDSIT